MTEELNSAQKEAVAHSHGPLLIAAGAGSGKTRTLTGRMIRLLESGANPRSIVAITFTNKAAREMKDRILKRYSESFSSNDQPFIGTFHSLGARILRSEARFFGRKPDFVIFDDDDSKKILRRILNKFPGIKEKWGASKLLNEFSRYKSRLNTPDNSDSEEKEEIHAAFLSYENALQSNNAFDFDDLIEKVVRLFDKEPEVLGKYQNRFEHILVDEYQDTNTSQYQFIKLLASAHGNICVVGDDNQAIYGFRNADIRNFSEFEKDWPQAKVVLLEENYRSSGNIIKAAGALIKNNRLASVSWGTKNIWTKNENGPLVKVVEASDETEEAEYVAEEAGNLKPNAEEKVAVLYRTNAQSRAVEQSLIERDLPYEIFGGLKFYERKEIKDALAGVRFAVNSRDEVSKERLEKTFAKKISRELMEKLPDFNAAKTGEILGFFLKSTNYFQYLENNFPNAAERQENVKALIEFAFNFTNPVEFLEKIALLQATDNDSQREGSKKIVLSTIHLAKGLEFDKVFIIGCSEGLLPHQLSFGKAENLEEERRLMYVAMTRAKHELCLSFYNYPSRFLYEIPPETTTYVSLVGGDKKPFYEKDEDEIYID